jgi:hypothetical protein
MTRVTANVADDACQGILDGVEKGLARLPVDDPYRHGLLLVRQGLMQRLGQDPFSAAAPAPLAPVLALSELDDARRRKHHRLEDEQS